MFRLDGTQRYKIMTWLQLKRSELEKAQKTIPEILEWIKQDTGITTGWNCILNIRKWMGADWLKPKATRKPPQHVGGYPTRGQLYALVQDLQARVGHLESALKALLVQLAGQPAPKSQPINPFENQRRYGNP